MSVPPAARRGRVEGAHHIRVGCGEADMRASGIRGLADAEVERRRVGEVGHSLGLEVNRVSERLESHLVERSRCFEVAYADLHVVDHLASFRGYSRRE